MVVLCFQRSPPAMLEAFGEGILFLFQRTGKIPQVKKTQCQTIRSLHKGRFFFPKRGFKNRQAGDAQTGLVKDISRDSFIAQYFQDSDGRYFFSILVEEGVLPLSVVGNVIGLDMGIKDVVVGSDGLKSGNPNYTYKYEKSLRREQKSLARKRKGLFA